METTKLEPQPAAQYKDGDLVYVDPDTRTVVGPLEWSRNGNPRSLPVPPKPEKEKEGRRGSGKKYYPWGTYRSMKHVFRLEGKPVKTESTQTLDEAIAKAMTQPFWD